MSSLAKGRNGNIDAIRLAAAFGVISLHIPSYPELDPLSIDLIRDISRWCVPFFFLVTGYYLYSGQFFFPKVTIERIVRPAGIFAVACMVFLPVMIIFEGLQSLALTVLTRGTYGHLWYLNSLVISMVALECFRINRIYKAAIIAASIVTAAYLAINLVFAVTHRHYDTVMLVRHLIGIPLIMLGCAFRRMTARNSKLFGAILAGGILLQIGEALALDNMGIRSGDIQMFPSTLLIVFGIFGLALTLNVTSPAWLSRWGREDSLGIYLYHPAFMLLTIAIIERHLTNMNTSSGILLWMIAFLATAAALRVLTLVPPLRRLADGDLSILARRSRREAHRSGFFLRSMASTKGDGASRGQNGVQP